jgi:hypothetical protein
VFVIVGPTLLGLLTTLLACKADDKAAAAATSEQRTSVRDRPRLAKRIPPPHPSKPGMTTLLVCTLDNMLAPRIAARSLYCQLYGSGYCEDRSPRTGWSNNARTQRDRTAGRRVVGLLFRSSDRTYDLYGPYGPNPEADCVATVAELYVAYIVRFDRHITVS